MIITSAEKIMISTDIKKRGYDSNKIEEEKFSGQGVV